MNRPHQVLPTLHCYFKLALRLPFHVLLIRVFYLSLLLTPTVFAQTGTGLNITPIISILLFDECSEVTPDTTVMGNQSIMNQDDLNALMGIRRIEGDLSFINNSTVLDFSPLDSLVELTGNLRIEGSQNTTINGFDCLSSIAGALDFVFNDHLTDAPNFPVLTSIGTRLEFSFNNGLTGISGFPALSSIAGNLSIFFNDNLLSISGFSAIMSISGNTSVFSNQDFDCSNPVPPFVPVNTSNNNSVDCDEINHTVFNSVSIPIPDNNINGVTDSIVINDEPGMIESLTVDLNITHTYVNDLTVTLSNGTTTIELLKKPRTPSDTQCLSNNINVNLSDSPASLAAINESCAAGTNDEAFPDTSYIPLQALSGFNNSTVNGSWTLKITDTGIGDSGTLTGWGLNFTKH